MVGHLQCVFGSRRLENGWKVMESGVLDLRLDLEWSYCFDRGENALRNFVAARRREARAVPNRWPISPLVNGGVAIGQFSWHWWMEYAVGK